MLFLFALLDTASATALTQCGVSRLADVGSQIQIALSCVGSSSAPGGPVSRFVVKAPDLPLSLWLRGVEVGAFERVEVREDGSAVYQIPGEVVHLGLGYVVRGDEPFGMEVLPSTPDIGVLRRCKTNPDTCLGGIRKVPEALAPALRLQACIAGQSCGPLRKNDPLTAETRAALELSCLGNSDGACEWLADIDPDGGWSMVQLDPPGRGELQAQASRFVRQPSEERQLPVGWTDEIPSEPGFSSAYDDTVQPATSRNGLEARWTDDGLELFRGRKRVWRWDVSGVDGVALREDGEQMLVRKGGLVAWVAFEPAQMLPFQGYPTDTAGSRLSGGVMRADGWPAPGTRVSAPCDANDTEFSCDAVTDLLGRFTLVGHHGSKVRVSGPLVPGGVLETVVVEGLPIRLSEPSRVFSFVADGEGRVTEASEPVRVGDRVVTLGPLPVDSEPEYFHGWSSSVPVDAWPGLATAWGSLVVEREGQRITLR